MEALLSEKKVKEESVKYANKFGMRNSYHDRIYQKTTVENGYWQDFCWYNNAYLTESYLRGESCA